MNEFKIGQEIWWFDFNNPDFTHDFKPSDLLLKHGILKSIKHGCCYMEDSEGAYIIQCFNSKREALEALSRHLKELLDE